MLLILVVNIYCKRSWHTIQVNENKIFFLRVEIHCRNFLYVDEL